MGTRREIQITIPVERFQDLLAAPLTWGELARLSAMQVQIGPDQDSLAHFWRVQMLEMEEDKAYRAQVCVRAIPWCSKLQIDSMQKLLPADAHNPNVGLRCTEANDQHSPRQDPRYMFFSEMGEWRWICQVHYTYRYARWDRRWQMLLCDHGRQHNQSTTQRVLSDYFRDILPFLVKMRYHCVSEKVLQEIREDNF